eukprot:307166-Rhodomonas_salina.1
MSLAFPGSHAAHGPPAGPAYPALQRHCSPPSAADECAGHSEQLDAPTPAKLPVGQSMHQPVPSVFLYDPGEHSPQVPDSVES